MMLIRNQSGTSLMNFSNITVIYAVDKAIKVFFSTEKFDFDVIGIYSSEEKAISVLNQIQDTYEFIMTQKEYFTFQMPQDSEVE